MNTEIEQLRAQLKDELRAELRAELGRMTGARRPWRTAARTRLGRSRARMVVLAVLASVCLSVGGATAATSTVPSGFTAVGPVTIENNASMAAHAALSPVVIGGTTTVPTDATQVQVSVTVSAGTASGQLLAYPAGAPSTTPLLSWAKGQTVTVSTTLGVGTKNQDTFVNSSTGSAKLLVKITAYTSQGPQGPPGPQGVAGTSVASTSEPAGTNCANGGARFQVGTGTPTYACNGAPGAAGTGLPTCSSGESPYWNAYNSDWECFTAANANAICPTNQVQYGTDANGAPRCDYRAFANQSCSAPEVVTGFTLEGLKKCGNPLPTFGDVTQSGTVGLGVSNQWIVGPVTNLSPGYWQVHASGTFYSGNFAGGDPNTAYCVVDLNGGGQGMEHRVEVNLTGSSAMSLDTVVKISSSSDQLGIACHDDTGIGVNAFGWEMVTSQVQ